MSSTKKRGFKPLHDNRVFVAVMQTLLFVQMLLCTVLLFGTEGEQAIPALMLMWALTGIVMLICDLVHR